MTQRDTKRYYKLVRFSALITNSRNCKHFVSYELSTLFLCWFGVIHQKLFLSLELQVQIFPSLTNFLGRKEFPFIVESVSKLPLGVPVKAIGISREPPDSIKPTLRYRGLLIIIGGVREIVTQHFPGHVLHGRQAVDGLHL